MTPPQSSLSPFVWPQLQAVPGLVHGVFTRHGGVSRPPYATLNAAFGNGDSPEAVSENLRRIASWLDLNLVVATPQVHGTQVLVVDEAFLHARPQKTANGFFLMVGPQADAMVTACVGVGLLIRIADCQAVFLMDPVRRVVANVHCGWRGSVGNILAETVRVMRTGFGTRPEDLLAAISPSLGPCCAEFRHFTREIPPHLWGFQVRPTYFDFWSISRHQLTACGVRPENIHAAQVCTVCHRDTYFSYRGEKTKGRMAAVIGLTSP